jgi:CheY-like chemotaxis protein
MGLAIVHGIVTSHGGAITVQSTLGEGTTFTLYLPQMAQDPAPPSAPPAPIVPPGKGRLLLVDDEEMLARLGQALLEGLGYEVVAYSSSLAALEAFQAEPCRFDLIITDQTMPVMTGATLVAELRHIRPDIPIILCTGFSHLMNAEKAEALGVDAFVLKPGVTQELAATIQQVLENRARQGR